MYMCVCMCVCIYIYIYIYGSQTHGNRKQNASCQSLGEEEMKMTPVSLCP